MATENRHSAHLQPTAMVSDGHERFEEEEEAMAVTRRVGEQCMTTGPPFATDVLCLRNIVLGLIESNLTRLYPLIPIVHGPSFRDAPAADHDMEDPCLRNLIIAICAAVVGTMPSQFEQYRNHAPPLPFATRRDMLNRFYDHLLNARESSYFYEISFQKRATSYLMVYPSFKSASSIAHG